MEHESLRLRAAVVYALTLAQPACGQQLGSTFQRRFILGRGACATPGGGQGSYSEVWELSHERCAEACLNDRECVAYEYSTTKRYKLCEKHKEVPSHSVPVDNSACFVLESALSLRTFKPFRGGDARYRGAVSAAGPLGWPPPPPAIVVPPRACGSPSSMPSSMPSSSSGGDGFAGCDLRLVQWDGLSVESVNLDGADLSGGSFTRAQFFRSTLRQAGTTRDHPRDHTISHESHETTHETTRYHSRSHETPPETQPRSHPRSPERYAEITRPSLTSISPRRWPCRPPSSVPASSLPTGDRGSSWTAACARPRCPPQASTAPQPLVLCLSRGGGVVLINNRSSLGASLLFCDLKDIQVRNTRHSARHSETPLAPGAPFQL